jgi:hypothetical protein
VVAISEAWAWTLRSWAQILFKAWLFVLDFLCCVVLRCVDRVLRDGLNHSPEGVLSCAYTLKKRAV